MGRPVLNLKMKDEITIIDPTAEIAKTITANELQGASADELQSAFTPLFESAREWRERAASIKVTNIGQTTTMGDARKARLEIRAVRLNAEKAKDRLKADSLRYGRAVQGLYNTILLLTEPVEQYLLDQEEYGKRQQEKVQADQRELRTIEAGELLKYFPAGVDLGTMADEEFARHLHLAGVQYKAIQDEQNRIESERIERERKEAAERADMIAENERLRAEAEKQAAQMESERAAAAKIQAEKDAKLAAQRKEMERLRDESLAKERAERERVMAENRAEMERDNAERERLRKDQEAKEAAEKAAIEAPDKEKLLKLANEISLLHIPVISSNSMSEVLEEAKSNLLTAIKILTNA